MADKIVDKRKHLIQAAEIFTQALLANHDPEHVLNALADRVVIHEHGLKQLAPFLGRQFHGVEGAKEYFNILASTVILKEGKVQAIFVDPEKSQVTVKGQAKFIWKSTAQTWDEIWSFLLEFDSEYKVKVYEVWGDPGAAYLASQGLLKQ